MVNYTPQPEKGGIKPVKLELCEKMVLAKIGGLNISAGVPFILKGYKLSFRPTSGHSRVVSKGTMHSMRK